MALLLALPLPAAATQPVPITKVKVNPRVPVLTSSRITVKKMVVPVKAPKLPVVRTTTVHKTVPVKPVGRVTVHHTTSSRVIVGRPQVRRKYVGSSSISLLNAALTGRSSRLHRREVRVTQSSRRAVHRRRPLTYRRVARTAAPSLLKTLQYQMDLLQMNESLGQ